MESFVIFFLDNLKIQNLENLTPYTSYTYFKTQETTAEILSSKSQFKT